MRRTRWMLPGLAVMMASLVVGPTGGGVAGGVSAAEFTQAELFVELNDTDGDLGLHAAIDGGPYVALEIEDPGRAVDPQAHGAGTPGPAGSHAAVVRERRAPVRRAGAREVLPAIPGRPVRDRGDDLER